MFGWLKKLFKKKETSKREKIISAIISFGYIYGLGWASASAPDAFYASLIKPELTPPNWIFPIVWTILFFLIGLSGYFVWNLCCSQKRVCR